MKKVNKTRTGGLQNDFFNPKIEHPNAELHLRMSMKKSVVRIVGLICLGFWTWIGIILLIIAEIYGIREELV
tara:strand:+ start:179 stop:394 length:216 start_codon:yes stop_codon:yes gene_type:complete